ncbi:MAG: hypothetical protein R2838_10540 [Caldilineaceae bacterium]
MDLPVIPPDEQQSIADFLAEATKLIGESVAHIEREIELLQEFRSILIAEP